MDSGDDDPGSREPDDYWYPSPLLASWPLTGEWRPNGAAWPPSAPVHDPGPPTRIDPSGPAAPVVGPTAALRGRAGGPGFPVDRDQLAGDQLAGDQLAGDRPAGDPVHGGQVHGDPVHGYPARSGWQVAQGVWHGSGIRWDEPAGAAPGPGSAAPGHAEQAFAAGPPRAEEPPAAQAFLSAPTMADAPPDWVVPGTPLATEEASERYTAWRESVREAVLAQGGRSAPLSNPRRGDQSPRAPQGSPTGNRLGPPEGTGEAPAGTSGPLGVLGPVGVIVVVGAGALLMLTGRASPVMNDIPGNQGGQAHGATASPKATAHASAGAHPKATAHPQATASTRGFGGYRGQRGTVTVSSFASSSGTRLAVGGADGHPAIWRNGAAGAWSIVSGLGGRTASGQVYGVTATAAGFVAAGTNAGHAAVWLTRTGLSWTPLDLPLPGGTVSAALRFTAARGGTVVAAGEADTGHGTLPFVAMSRDDGQKWQQVGLPASGGGTVTALTASPAGFTVAGTAGGRPVRWTSPDGVTWTSATSA